MQPHCCRAACIKNAFVLSDSVALRHCRTWNQWINFDPYKGICEKRANLIFAALYQSSAKQISHIQHALRYIGQLQAFVHRGLAQFFVGFLLRKTLALHE